MKNLKVVLFFLLAALNAAIIQAQNPTYPPLSQYLMTPEAETALARSAAPEGVSAHASVKILRSRADNGTFRPSGNDDGLSAQFWIVPLFGRSDDRCE
jgi:hypothetical protein